MATAYVDPHTSDDQSDTAGSNMTASDSSAGESKGTEAVEAEADDAPNAIVSKLKDAAVGLIWPIVGILSFIAAWAVLAPQVDTSLGALPGPLEVIEAGGGLYTEYSAAKDAEAAFYEAQDASNAAAIAAGNTAGVRDFEYAGPPTFLDQIVTSLQTVALGFFLATVFAVPIGLMAGLSTRFNAAINPLVQIMKPVSPLAWLPIVTMVISAMITSSDPLLPKAFVISALVVMLCSLWPTLINTAVGTSSIDKDLLNVGKVLRLGWFDKLTKLVLPASLPYIFTGMRLSLGVGWMVLIAAEMLAQNPGLGKFVWDEFQNGSSQSLARIMFAVIVIGLIGFLLDRLMMTLQSLVSKNRTV
ncbi:MAG: ABC transporter permease [Pseudomonadota bacterium]|nr:ABC transporter permease [Pseudomonadota bacterium]